MKIVYLAEDLHLDRRPCALAELSVPAVDARERQAALARFERESRILAELSNPHIPRLYDSFAASNAHYLVMQYFAGSTLEEVLKQAGGRLPQLQVLKIALDLADTLDYLHHLEPPIIYGDLKPSNIIITGSGETKLIDFGIARYFGAGRSATIIGTPGYAPPEQYSGKVEPRSDIYALAAVMHQALSGRDPAANPPFHFPPLKQLRRSVSPKLADLMDCALQYATEKRVPSAREFKQRLAALVPAPGLPQVTPGAPTTAVAARRFCTNCGKPQAATDAFCTNCGTAIEQSHTAMPSPKPQAQPVNSKTARAARLPVRPVTRDTASLSAVRRSQNAWAARFFLGALACICIGAAALTFVNAMGGDKNGFGPSVWLLMQGLAFIWIVPMITENTSGPASRWIGVGLCGCGLSFSLLCVGVSVSPFEPGGVLLFGLFAVACALAMRKLLLTVEDTPARIGQPPPKVPAHQI